MDPGWGRDILTAGVGIVTGALSGAFGVGGAVVSTPGIRALGVPALTAVGTTLPSILPSAIGGALRYRSEGLVDWGAVRATLPLGVIASVAGALLSGAVPGEGHLLMLATAGFLVLVAVRMAAASGGDGMASASGEEAPAGGDGSPRPSPSRPQCAVVGLVAGALSGLLGIGGGTVLVPGYSWAGLPIKATIATSLVCVGGLAVPGTLTHAYLGNIDWRVAAALALTVMPGAWLGAAGTVRADDRRVRRAVAVVLGAVAVLYAAGEVAALLA